MTQRASPSAPRAICDLIGSVASADIFVDSPRTSSAWDAPRTSPTSLSCRHTLLGKGTHALWNGGVSDRRLSLQMAHEQEKSAAKSSFRKSQVN
jgi:hypothetical protein